MFELLVTANLIDLVPAVSFQPSNDLAAVHDSVFTSLFLHILYTCKGVSKSMDQVLSLVKFISTKMKGSAFSHALPSVVLRLLAS
jgi:hypothetical protein